MRPNMEAIADAASGGVFAGSVEPRPVEGAGRTDEGACLNCGCRLIGDYCHCCGQRSEVHRTISAFWHDLLHGVLHFEGKVWRTLPMLAFHPGQLTRRYVNGERAKFVSPLALFLFSVFLMFAVFKTFGGPMALDSTAAQDRAEAIADLKAEKQDAEKDIASLRQDIGEAQRDGQPTQMFESQIKARQTELAAEEKTAALAIRRANQEQAKEDKYRATGEIEPFNLDANSGWPALDTALEHAAKNPSLLLYKVQTSAYKYSWALIPISLPFLWLLFLHRLRYRREHGAYDHLIFITYSIAFMSLGAIVLALLRSVGVGDAIIGSAVALVPPIHIYRQLRGAYGLSKWSALWRTFLLIAFAFVALGLFVTLLLMLGAFG